MPRLSPSTRSVLEAAPDAIIVISEAGVIRAFNPAAEALFGYTEADVAGKNVSLLMPEPYHSEHDNYLRRYHRTGEKRIIGSIREVVAVDAEGREFPIDLSVGELADTGGPERQYVGIVRDLSRIRATESQLAEEEELYRRAVEYAPHGLVAVDEFGTIQRFNRAFARITLASPGKLRRGRWDDLLHPDDRAGFREWVAGVWAGGDGSERRRFRLIRANGDVCAVAMEMGRVVDKDRAPTLLVIHVEDVTEAERTRQVEQHVRDRLAHGDRLSAMAEMTAGLAHELNQPLSAIGIYAQACSRLIRAGEVETDELLDVLSRIDSQAERAGAIIARLREFVRKRESIRTRCNLNELVHNIAKLAAIDVEPANIRFRFDFDDSVEAVMVDTVQIEQVVLNLVRNGIEATIDLPAVIEVGTRREADVVVVSIKDQGIGLADSDIDEIFHPFHTTKESGMGIGLTICQSIVAAHGGHLKAAANEDRGSIFSFTLPMDDGRK